MFLPRETEENYKNIQLIESAGLYLNSEPMLQHPRMLVLDVQ
jgi:hypothetical protein